MSVPEAKKAKPATSGQGDAVFSWDEELTAAFPAAARPFEKDMHGGFNEDPETGIVYTGVPGYGLVAISPDLKTWTKIGTDPVLLHNIHGIVCFKYKGETLLAVAQNNAEQVAVLGLDGSVKQVITKPTGTEFDFAEANTYYTGFKDTAGGEGSKIFNCTDVTFLNDTIYVVTGYCAGDFVLTITENDGVWAWAKTAWGGKGEKPGQFKTAHGVFAHQDHIFVANREAHQVVKFTPAGSLVRVLPGIPAGSRICNISYAEKNDYLLLNPLAKVTEDQVSAPIYAYAHDHIISTIIPGDLGIPVLRHVHHVWPHYVTDDSGASQLYILVHGWNVGKFAVLRHHPEL